MARRTCRAGRLHFWHAGVQLRARHGAVARPGQATLVDRVRWRLNSAYTSFAGTALLKKNPCASVQPTRFKKSSSPLVSTPSPVVSIPRLLASWATARTMARESFLDERPRTKTRSILILSNGKFLKELNDE